MCTRQNNAEVLPFSSDWDSSLGQTSSLPVRASVRPSIELQAAGFLSHYPVDMSYEQKSTLLTTTYMF